MNSHESPTMIVVLPITMANVLKHAGLLHLHKMDMVVIQYFIKSVCLPQV